MTLKPRPWWEPPPTPPLRPSAWHEVTLTLTYEAARFGGHADSIPADAAATYSDDWTGRCDDCRQPLARHVITWGGRVLCPGDWLIRRHGAKPWEWVGLTSAEMDAAWPARADLAAIRQALDGRHITITDGGARP